MEYERRLALSVPAAIGLREVSIFRFLKNEIPAEEFGHHQSGAHLSETVVSLRDVIRQCVTDFLKNWREIRHSRESPFTVMLTFRHEQSQKEVERLEGGRKKGAKRRWHDKGQERSGPRSGLNDQKVKDLALKLSWEEFKNEFECPPGAVLHAAQALARVHRMPLYLSGRYMKLRRDISHTPFFVDNERIGRTSVQEVIADAVGCVVAAADHKLISAGREDMDVRMLGDGRPFVLEIEDPRVQSISADQIRAIEAELSSGEKGVVVRDLRACCRQVVDAMKEGEAEKRKTYKAVVWMSAKISDDTLNRLNATRDFEIDQDTPIRVLHRRAALIRGKRIFEMHCERIPGEEHYFLLRVDADAGTYIKEFIHGDLGRTHPSVSSILGCDVQCVQLDVTSVVMAAAGLG